MENRTVARDASEGNLAPAMALTRARRLLERGSALTLAELYSTAKAIENTVAKIVSQGTDFSETRENFRIERIAVLGGTNIDYLASTIACAAVLEGVAPVIYRAPYGAYVQEILDRHSGLFRFSPTAVVIATDWRDIAETCPPESSGEEISAKANNTVRMFSELWGVLSNSFSCKIFQHILPFPDYQYRGVAERDNRASAWAQIAAINSRLLEESSGQVTWIDMDRFQRETGIKNYADIRLYHATKVSFNPKLLMGYIPYFRAAWRSAFACEKKVLILDLDNTIWGGTIGDDGLEGIRLGPGSIAGEAHSAWTRYLSELRNRGVVLAVCSKNEADIAKAGFDHAHCHLAANEFAAFECSWEDKVAGIRRIATKLNLGTESFVFADDNSAECELVSQELPEVAVVLLGEDPTQFINIVEYGHWFDLQRYSAEDFSRGDAYTGRRKAEEESVAATDIGSFLHGLQMKGDVHAAGDGDLLRLAQLELKTNQFNLTTRRYTRADLVAFLALNNTMVFAFRLKDRLADHGLVGSMIAVQEDATVRIDSWLMSCRVFSRSAEQFMIQHLGRVALARGAKRIVGERVPTDKNGVVADLYRRLGFESDGGDQNRWYRDLDETSFTELECFIERGADGEQRID